LYYLNSRYYNPEIGRFINADGLIGQTGDILGHNMYAYTQNNPVMMVDPNGYSPLSWLEDRWNDIKDAWNYWYIPDEKYYIPSSGEVAKTFIYSILGIADESIIKVLDGVIERGYQNIGYTDMTGLRFVFKTANFGLKAFSYGFAAFDVANTWTSRNLNTVGDRILKTGIQIGGMIATYKMSAIGVGFIAAGISAGALLPIVAGATIIIATGALVYYGSEFLYNELDIE
jgi:hypothetical protein